MKYQHLKMAALSVAAIVAAGCVGDPPPFDPQVLQQIQREGVRDLDRELRPIPDRHVSPLPERPGDPPPVRPGLPEHGREPIVAMTLQEVIHRAVASNHEVRIAGYQAAIDGQRVIEAEARFDPSLFASYQLQRNYSPLVGTDPLDPVAVLTQVGAAGVRQILPTGAQVELRGQVTHHDRDVPAAFGAGRFYESDLVLQISQPLLRDFGGDVNRARITVARNDQRISALDFQDRLERTVLGVEELYWQLAFAQRDHEILDELRRRTEETLQILVDRAEHDVGGLQIAQADAAVARSRANLVRSRARIRETSDRLKALIGDPDLSVAGADLIVASDAPVLEPLRLQLSDQIETALQNRLELQQQELRLDSAGTVVRAAQNNLLPQLNLIGSAGFQGLGEDFRDALRSQTNADFVNLAVGVSFEIPIGNRQARAIYQRTLLQRQQAIDQYRQILDQVSLQVKAAHRDVYTAWDEIIETRRARLAAAEALEVILVREREGEALTFSFVQLKLDAQSQLAEATRQETQAIISYNLAIAALERAKGTLLRYNNVAMKEVAPGF